MKTEEEKIKRNSRLLWLAFVVCLLSTIVLWFLVNRSDPKYEEVKAVVLSSEKTEIVNRKTKTRTNKYDVKVTFNGKTYDLKNVHDLVSYPKGKTIVAYKAKDKLYANVEGVKTSTPLATVYFICLFGSFGLLILAPSYSAKLRQIKKENKEEE